MPRHIKEHIISLLEFYAETTDGREEENARVNNEALVFINGL